MEFIEAFAPVMAEAIALAYKGAPSELQNKIKRVVDVWRDRQVFEQAIQDAIDGRIAGAFMPSRYSSHMLRSMLTAPADLDKLKGSTSFGASPFSPAAPAVPSELAPLVTSYQNSVKHQIPAKSTAAAANQDYTRTTDSSSPVPSAPVYAARLNGLMNVLASAEGAVAESVKARKGLIDALEKLLDEHKAALASDEEQLEQLKGRKNETEQKKQDVETNIMQGLNTKSETQQSSSEDPAASNTPPEPDRPEMEALTPPSVHEEPELPGDIGSPFAPETSQQDSSFQQGSAPGIEMLSTLASQYQSLPVVTNGSNKRRKIEGDEEVPGLGGDDGLDADVAEMLRKDSGSN